MEFKIANSENGELKALLENMKKEFVEKENSLVEQLKEKTAEIKRMKGNG